MVESAAASEVKTVDGEVVESREEARMDREEAAASTVREGDEVKVSVRSV